MYTVIFLISKAIANFAVDGRRKLALQLGDTVQILEECAGRCAVSDLLYPIKAEYGICTHGTWIFLDNFIVCVYTGTFETNCEAADNFTNTGSYINHVLSCVYGVCKCIELVDLLLCTGWYRGFSTKNKQLKVSSS